MRVALEVPLPRLFDYALPDGAAAAMGDRVTVPLGRRNQTGVVMEADIASEVDAERLKSIVDVRSDAPRLSADWLELMRFLSSYYQRPLGETVVSRDRRQSVPLDSPDALVVGAAHR